MKQTTPLYFVPCTLPGELCYFLYASNSREHHQLTDLVINLHVYHFANNQLCQLTPFSASWQ